MMKQLTSRQFGLRDMAGAVWRHRLLAATLFGLTLLGAAAGAWQLPDQYEARMKILVKNTRAELVVSPDQDNAAVNHNEVTETQLNSEVELLRSQDILEQVVKEQRLAPANAPGEVEKAVRQLEKNLSVAPLKKADLIEVKYVAASPQQAAVVLQQFGKLYLDKHLQAHRPAGTYEFFKTQSDAYAAELRDAEARLEAFRRANNVVSLDAQKSIGLQRLSDTQAKLRDADGALNEANRRVAALNDQLSRTPPRIPTQQRTLPNQFTAERLTTLLVELRNRRAQLLSKFRPEDRLIKELDEQIKITSAELEAARRTTAQEQATDVNPLRQTLEGNLTQTRVEYAGHQALRANLAQQEQTYKQQVAQLENATRTHEDLTRRVQEAKENYQLYAQKQEEARIANALDEKKISNVVITEPARVPTQPARPNRPLIVLTGFVLGLLLSLGSVFTLEFFRDTVNTPGELERLTGHATLATLPAQRQRRLSSGPAAALTTGRVIAEINRPGGDAEVKKTVIAHTTNGYHATNGYPTTNGNHAAPRPNVRSAITIVSPLN